MKFLHLKYVVIYCAAAVVARAGGAWTGLQAGMNPVQVQRLVGQPLFATVGHGYLRWSFDRLGDVTFYRGAVVSWTEPRLAAETAAGAVASKGVSSSSRIPVRLHGGGPVSAPAVGGTETAPP